MVNDRLCRINHHYLTVSGICKVLSLILRQSVRLFRLVAQNLILGQKSVSRSPTGSPTAMATMLEFAARHNIAPQSRIFSNEQSQRHARAFNFKVKRVTAIVLEADF